MFAAYNLWLSDPHVDDLHEALKKEAVNGYYFLDREFLEQARKEGVIPARVGAVASPPTDAASLAYAKFAKERRRHRNAEEVTEFGISILLVGAILAGGVWTIGWVLAGFFI